MIITRKALACDAVLIGASFRAEDHREVLRMGQGDPASVLRRNIEASDIAIVFEKDGVPLGAAGICSTLDVGHPWLIGTGALRRYPKAFLMETRRWLAEVRGCYRILNNFVDAEYAGALRWLSWLGFTIGPPLPVGLRGALFCHVEMRC